MEVEGTRTIVVGNSAYGVFFDSPSEEFCIKNEDHISRFINMKDSAMSVPVVEFHEDLEKTKRNL